jgi:hypothetical protein
MRITTFRSLAEAEPFLRKLAVHLGPWVFDIETYDAEEFPSRKHVAVDPCHPDFRVRGCAFALSKDIGAWVEFVDPLACSIGVLGSDADPLGPLAAAFASDAEKGAFNGGFDENGLVYGGWVPVIRNRVRDGMLSMVALGDGTHGQHGMRLEAGVVRLLKREAYWGGVDKGLMRDLPIEVVADGAVRDACATYELCDFLDAMATEGRHIEWSRM